MTLLFISSSIFALIYGTAWMLRNFPLGKQTPEQIQRDREIREAFSQGVQRGKQLSEPFTLHVYREASNGR